MINYKIEIVSPRNSVFPELQRTFCVEIVGIALTAVLR